ncbi:MAG: hypothetical protein ACFFBP_04660 [Promethearchaeota archaeon]
MKNSHDQNNVEINHYVEIIEFFEAEDDKNKREIFRDKYLSSLMTILKQNPNAQNIVKNCIVIMNVLINDTIPPDRYNRIGWDREDLSRKDAKLLKKMLRHSIAVK